jgi:hypothetical protein
MPMVTESDYQVVSEEMQKKKFVPEQKTRKGVKQGEKPFVFTHSGRESLLDLTVFISRALETTGKKYSFTIMREKSQTD